MIYKDCVIDAGNSVPEMGLYSYRPVIGKFPVHFKIIEDVELVQYLPPLGWKLGGIYHSEGQKAVVLFYKAHRERLRKLWRDINGIKEKPTKKYY